MNRVTVYVGNVKVRERWLRHVVVREEEVILVETAVPENMRMTFQQKLSSGDVLDFTMEPSLPKVS